MDKILPPVGVHSILDNVLSSSLQQCQPPALMMVIVKASDPAHCSSRGGAQAVLTLEITFSAFARWGGGCVTNTSNFESGPHQQLRHLSGITCCCCYC